ncbi:MAG TPA: oxidoreductase [Actinobacteria bacterium]|nr:oxidoreductase [Actinomycetota bacterium]
MKTVLVTGASSGIGAATARLLAGDGWQVIAAARRLDRLAALGPDIEAVELDVTDAASVAALAQRFTHQPLHALVSNAGGAWDAAPVEAADLESWQRAYDVNLLGTVRVVQAVLPALRQAADAHILLMGSTAGRVVYENGGSYTAAKHAVAALAGTLRLELCGEPIRVTEIAPGMVHTDEFAVNRFSGDAAKAAKVYEGVAEPLTAEDVAETVRWSLSLPRHVNIDLLVVRPVAQAAQHKVHRVL